MVYSVIVSSIGRSDYLLELLESITIQTRLPQDLHILLDRDTASMECAAAIREVRAPFLITTHHLEDSNLPTKRNQALRYAETNIILFSDDDDLWHPLRAELVIQAIYNGYWAVCHNYSCFGSQNQTNCSKLGIKSRPLSILTLLHGDNIYGGGSSIACRKELLSCIPFDESLSSCEDFDWWIRVQLSSVPIYYIGLDLASYRRHSSNMGKSKHIMSSTLLAVARKNLLIGLYKIVIALIIGFRSLVRRIR
jgi:glycosyltransferase involved in cell wall biosynthesis